MRAADKVMFEIYREAHYNREFKVVYFTELNDHNREQEFNHALAGDHVFDGFLVGATKDEGKAVIAGIIARLNDGEAVSADEIRTGLADFLA